MGDERHDNGCGVRGCHKPDPEGRPMGIFHGMFKFRTPKPIQHLSIKRDLPRLVDNSDVRNSKDTSA